MLYDIYMLHEVWTTAVYAMYVCHVVVVFNLKSANVTGILLLHSWYCSE